MDTTEIENRLIDAELVIDNCFMALREIRAGLHWEHEYKEHHIFSEEDKAKVREAWRLIKEYKKSNNRLRPLNK